jgi:hypothetical protein
MLMTHSWPGNVRELRNTVSRILLFQSADVFVPQGSGSADAPATPAKRPISVLFYEARNALIADFERRYVTEQLKAHKGEAKHAEEPTIFRSTIATTNGGPNSYRRSGAIAFTITSRSAFRKSAKLELGNVASCIIASIWFRPRLMNQGPPPRLRACQTLREHQSYRARCTRFAS